jgi:hypothetical protein
LEKNINESKMQHTLTNDQLRVTKEELDKKTKEVNDLIIKKDEIEKNLKETQEKSEIKERGIAKLTEDKKELEKRIESETTKSVKLISEYEEVKSIKGHSNRN